MMERKDFLGLIGFGVLGAQTGYVGACDSAEHPEPDAVRAEDLGSPRTSFIEFPENPQQGDMCVVLSPYRHMVYVNGEWLTVGVANA